LRKLIPVFLLFAATAAVFWPILVGGKIIAEEFTPHHQYPPLSFLNRVLGSEGATPFWFPGLMSGYPYYMGIGFSYLFPINFLFRWLNYITAFNVLTFLAFFLGALITYIFARNLSLSRPASTVTSFVYTFSQLNLWWGSILPFSFVLPIVPAVFLSTLKISRGRTKYIFLGAVMLAFGWLNAIPEYIFYLSAFSVFFALFLDILKKDYSVFFWRAFRTFKYSLLMTIVGGILALPKLLPIFDFVSLSARARGALGETSFLTLNLSQFLLPYFNIPYIDKLSPLFANSPAYLYVGIFPLILTVFFFAGLKRNIAKEKITLFFVILSLAGFLPLIKATHLFDLMRWLTFGLFGGSWKLLFLGNFSLALLAGFGLQHIEEIKRRKFFPSFLIFYKIFALFVLSCAVLLQFILFLFRNDILRFADEFFAKNLYAATAGKPLSHYYGLIEETFNRFFNSVSFGNYHFFISLIMILVPLPILYLFYKDKLSWLQFNKVVALAVVLNLVLIWQGFFKTIPRSLLVERPKTAEFLNKINGPFRVFRFWPGLSVYNELGLNSADLVSQTELEKELFVPNMGLLYGVDSVDGDENLMSYRQSKIQAVIGSTRSPQNEDKDWLNSKINFASKLSLFQSPQNRKLLSMMNVKYVLSSFDFDFPWKKVFETKVTKAGIPLYIYENPTVLPRVYFAQKVEFIEPDEETAFNKMLAVKDFKHTALVECLKPECVYAGYQSSPSDAITVKETKSGYLKLTTYTKYPRWLIYSESNLPTWEARVNGDLAPIYTANYLYQAIFVPPGDNEIIFNYPGMLKQTEYSFRRQVSKFFFPHAD
jgi:hypothetical protein